MASSDRASHSRYDIYLKRPLTPRQRDLLACGLERYGIMTQDAAKGLLESTSGTLRQNATRRETDLLSALARTLCFEVEIVPLPPMSEEKAAALPRCPYCGSFSVRRIRKSGFDPGKAAFGQRLGGPLGSVAGFLEDDRTVRFCALCHSEW